MNKRILALAIALLMACSSLAFADGEAGIASILGFGGEWASGSWGVSQLPLSDGDPIHVSCMFPRQSGHPISLDDTWWAKELLKRANVVIDWTLVEKAGFQDKKNLVLASGDYPDIFMDGITKVDEQTYGPQGVFVNLAPLIEEYAPNTCELFKMYPENPSRLFVKLPIVAPNCVIMLHRSSNVFAFVAPPLRNVAVLSSHPPVFVRLSTKD